MKPAGSEKTRAFKNVGLQGGLAHRDVTILKGDETFPMLAQSYSKGANIRSLIHKHPEAEICYFPYDTGAMLFESGAHRFEAGDMFLIAGNIYHHPVFDSADNRGLIVLYFMPEMLNQIPREWQGIKSMLASKTQGFCLLKKNQHAESLIKELHQTFQSQTQSSEIVCQGIFLHLISYFAQIISHQPIQKTDPQQLLLQKEFAKIIAYIDNNVSASITAQDLYRQAGLSRSRFCEKFKQSFGMTASTYIQQVRITRAKELLIYSCLSVTEIALNCGFNSPGFFNRVFKRDEGISPSEYKKLHSEK